LEKLGAGVAFGSKADFSFINPSNELYISNVIHQAVIEVNEEGTEAAAATAVVEKTKSIPRKIVIKEFVCDRPFMFIIHDNHHKCILFIGKYNNP
jgi:serine protease inhibitor